MSKIIVKKSTELALSYHNLPLIEHRFLNMCIGAIFYEDTIVDTTQCSLMLDRYARDYDITDKEAMSQLKKIKNSLLGRQVELPVGSKKYIPWVTAIEFITNDEIYVNFHKDMIPHISTLRGSFGHSFIRYNLDFVKNMTSMHSIRLYEIVKTKAYDKAGMKLRIDLVELKRKMAIGCKYNKYADFKRMIDACMLEINELTDIKVTLKERKLGKKVVRLLFLMESKSTIATEVSG